MGCESAIGYSISFSMGGGFAGSSINFAQVVPERSSMFLCGIGLAGLGVWWCRKTDKA